MSQGNCTLCQHSYLQEQLGEIQRICRKGPPVVVPIPQRGGVFMASVWPMVNEQMVCDVFETAPGVVS